MEILRDSEAGCRGLMSAVTPLVQYIMDITRQMRAPGAATPSLREVETELVERVRAVGRAALAEVVVAYAPPSELVDVGGRVFKRMPEPSMGRYVSLWGTVEVPRHLYREHGVHNGPTVVPLELRAGMIFGGWTPMAAEAVAHLYQALPAREAAETSVPRSPPRATTRPSPQATSTRTWWLD